MLVILDLDYTLFDTARFKGAVKLALSEVGVPPLAFSETYPEAFEKRGEESLYDPEEHARIFAARGFCGEAAASEAMRKALERAEEFLYDGTVEFLHALRGAGHETVLLTYGNPDWQKKKIEATGLHARVDSVIATPVRKTAIIGRFRGRDRVAVVNDNPAEIAELMAAAPEFLYVMRKGPKNAGVDLGIPVAHSYGEILECFKSYELKAKG